MMPQEYGYPNVHLPVVKPYYSQSMEKEIQIRLAEQKDAEAIREIYNHEVRNSKIITIKTNKKINVFNFKNDFEILSVLRNLKIIGIFTRLSIRDNKHTYLKLIPHAWNLIEQRIEQNKKFIELKIILDKYFSKKLRNKYEN